LGAAAQRDVRKADHEAEKVAIVQATRHGKVTIGDRKARMIDLHSHVIPETIIAAMRADPERYATRIDEQEGKRYLVRGKLRLELIPEFSVAEAKLEAMDRKGIEISVISPGPQVFFYNLNERDGITASQLVND